MKLKIKDKEKTEKLAISLVIHHNDKDFSKTFNFLDIINMPEHQQKEKAETRLNSLTNIAIRELQKRKLINPFICRNCGYLLSECKC